MWQTKRQTKKHRTKTRPKKIAQLIFLIVGVAALVFVIYSLSSLTKQPSLIVPVALDSSRVRSTSGSMSSATQEIEKALKAKHISFLFVTKASESAILITLPGNAEVMMKNENIIEQIASLQLITDRLTMEGKRFRRLDLRFDRPVVVLDN